MLSKKLYYIYHSNESYLKYWFKKVYKDIFRMCKKIFWDWIPASILCLRFRFLYPTGIYSNKYYTDNISRNEKRKLTEKYFYNIILPNPEKHQYISKRVRKFDDQHYIEKYGNKCLLFPDKNTKFNKVDEVYVFKKEALIWDKIVYFLYSIKQWIIETFVFIPTYTWLDSIETGWRKAFGIQMCKEIKQALLRCDRKIYKNYRITDIKEKWGCLDWFDNGCPNEVRDILTKYKEISYYTCIVCGKPARYLSNGWICPYCRDHINVDHTRCELNEDLTNKLDENGNLIPLERESFYGWQNMHIAEQIKLYKKLYESKFNKDNQS